ncbi:MAG: hypothetical protein SCARUB_04079 [Candidatus Scalindua rubra]|uniref:DUF1640 domain-containing protein n=1 Tax=Candidatus Scalindua rubra TaxID=1872076 RepID=A0A1E3X5A6_9BACT|nr:MAG: hypothetical protein SCARUB_04079 [Candidatus Scalindua rubra]
MPITEELKNVKKFESVGFTHQQAEALAETIEQAQASGQESLKEFIRIEMKGLRDEINASELRIKADLANSQKDLLIKIFGIIVGTVGIAVTILKLFP